MKDEKTIKVLLVDDHMVVRKGLGLVLNEAVGVCVVGEAESGEEALFLCKELKPDVILMDVKMEGMGGIEATRMIVQHHRTVKVIGLSTFANQKIISGMIGSGARGYLLKDISAADLIDAIQRVNSGETLLPDEYSIVPENTSPSLPIDDIPPLGAQQRRILALMTKGLTNPEIAIQVDISVSTVRYHVSAILKKLDVSNRSEATALAVRLDIVAFDDF